VAEPSNRVLDGNLAGWDVDAGRQLEAYKKRGRRPKPTLSIRLGL
jgi:hypothetical protein